MAEMSAPPPTRITIDRVQIVEGAARSEATIRRQIATGVAAALRGAGGQITAQSAVRLQLDGTVLSGDPAALGRSIGQALSGSANTGGKMGGST
jgi:hypothetical protein